jgi:Phage integrase family
VRRASATPATPGSESTRAATAKPGSAWRSHRRRVTVTRAKAGSPPGWAILPGRATPPGLVDRLAARSAASLRLAPEPPAQPGSGVCRMLPSARGGRPRRPRVARGSRCRSASSTPSGWSRSMTRLSRSSIASSRSAHPAGHSRTRPTAGPSSSCSHTTADGSHPTRSGPSWRARRRRRRGDITPHQLRHTYATALVNAGVSLQALMALLGHTSAEMSLRYGRLLT